MSTVRSIRLANSLEAGAIDAAALEALMADATRKGEFSGLMSMRGQARRMAENALSATAIIGSATANAVLQETRAGADEFASSPLASQIISASRSAMRVVTGSIAGFRRWLSQFPYGQRDIKMVNPNGVAYGANTYVAVNNAGLISSSPDAVTWTLRTNPLTSPVAFADVAFAFGLFVAIDVSGRVVTSPDGTTWTQRVQAVAGTVTTSCKIVVADGKVAFAMFTASGQVPAIIFSADGLTWDRTVAPGGTTVTAVYFLAFTGKFWVMGAGLQATTNYNFWYTPAGITTASTLTGEARIAGVSFSSGQFLNGWLYAVINGAVYRWNDALSTASQRNYAAAELSNFYSGAYFNGVLLVAVNGAINYRVSYDNGGTFFDANIAVPAQSSQGEIRVLNNTLFFVMSSVLYTNF